MNLMITGTTPIYIVIAFSIITLVFSIWVYRQQRVTGLWRQVLPFLRGFSLLALCLCLLQPVLTHQKEREFKGVIPIIIDNSESMGIADPYLEWQKLKLAAHLDLIEVEVSDAKFETRAEAWGKILENSHKLPSWLSTLIKKESDTSFQIRTEPILQWLKLFEQQFELEQKALKLDDWTADASENKASFEAFLKTKQTSLQKSYQLIKTTHTDSKKLLEEISKKTTDKINLDPLSNKLKLLIGLIRTQARNWIEVQISVGMERSQGLNPDLKLFDNLMKSPDRLELVKNCLASNAVLELLQKKGDLRFYNLETNQGEIPNDLVEDLSVNTKHTSLGTKIREILKQYDDQPISGIIILSDGNNNAGFDLASAKKMANERGIRILGAGVGGTYAPPDASVEKIMAPKSSFKGDLIRLQALIGREGFADRKLKVTLKSKDKEISSKIISAGNPGKKLVQFSITENNSGRQRYQIEVESLEGDVLIENNFKEVEIKILGDKIKTLFIEEFPRWESRYAAMMLERDPRIDLNAIFIASAPNGRLPIGKTAYPATRDGLHAYDILVLGDINPRHFNSEQLENLKSFILEGGTMMVIAGSQHMPHAYLQTPLIDILPLELSSNKTSKQSKIQIKLDSGSQFDDVIAIGHDAEETNKLWQGLPSLNWVNHQVNGTAIADTLVKTNQQAPIISRADIGAGKVLYLGTDSFWKWRNRARWTYHHRLWSQILLWATTSRTTGKDSQVKIMSSKGIYDPENKIEIKGKLLNSEGLPLRQVSASVEIIDENGQLVRKAPLIYNEGSAGDYKATLPPMKQGKYKVRPVLPDSDRDLKEAEINFEVKVLPTDERLSLQLNTSKLHSLCHEVKPLDELLHLIETIEPKTKTTTERVDNEIWDSFPFMLLISFLLGIEWHVRKKIGLV